MRAGAHTQPGLLPIGLLLGPSHTLLWGLGTGHSPRAPTMFHVPLNCSWEYQALACMACFSEGTDEVASMQNTGLGDHIPSLQPTCQLSQGGPLAVRQSQNSAKLNEITG